MISSEQIDSSVISNSVLESPTINSFALFPGVGDTQTVFTIGEAGGSKIYLPETAGRLLNPLTLPNPVVEGTTTVTIDIKDNFPTHSTSQIFLVNDFVIIEWNKDNGDGTFTYNICELKVTAANDMTDYWSYDCVIWKGTADDFFDVGSVVYITSDTTDGAYYGEIYGGVWWNLVKTQASPSAGAYATYDTTFFAYAGQGASNGVFIGDDGITNQPNLRLQPTTGIFVQSNSLDVWRVDLNSDFIINEEGSADIDMRIEGDTDANLFFTDASADMVGIGTNAPATKFDINSDSVRVRTAKTPASGTATGIQGQICWDANFIYVCTATDTWKRVAIATW